MLDFVQRKVWHYLLFFKRQVGPLGPQNVYISMHKYIKLRTMTSQRSANCVRTFEKTMRDKAKLKLHLRKQGRNLHKIIEGA